MKRPKSFIYFVLIREFRSNRVAVEAISLNGSGHGMKCGNVASAGSGTSETRSKRSTSVKVFFFSSHRLFSMALFVFLSLIPILIFFSFGMWIGDFSVKTLV